MNRYKTQSKINRRFNQNPAGFFFARNKREIPGYILDFFNTSFSEEESSLFTLNASCRCTPRLKEYAGHPNPTGQLI